MKLAKKLLFAPLFLALTAFSLTQLSPFFTDSSLIFSLDFSTLGYFITLSLGILLASLFFCLFVSLAADWTIIAPVIILGTLIPIAFLPQTAWFAVCAITLLGLTLTTSLQLQTLKNYLNFSPNALISPHARSLSKFLVIALSAGLFLQFTSAHQTFQVPDSLIDTALKFAPISSTDTQTPTIPSLPQLSPDQISLLKQNPALLKQYGVSPEMLDQLTNPKTTAQSSAPTTSNNLIKTAVKSQLQTMLKPYQSFIPGILALLFFVSLTSFVSLLGILLHFLIPLSFWLMEKTGFVTFTTEQRTVKKLVV